MKDHERWRGIVFRAGYIGVASASNNVLSRRLKTRLTVDAGIYESIPMVLGAYLTLSILIALTFKRIYLSF